MQQLGQVNGRFERQRMQLLRQERQTRQEMRRQMASGTSADQNRVNDLINQTLRIQRERLDLTEREQQELSQFMTPMQRAMYFGIQDEVRRRMEEMRQQGRPGAGQGRPGALRPRPLAPQPEEIRPKQAQLR
jgi:Spy/CpxP family protein refolding chaperone